MLASFLVFSTFYYIVKILCLTVVMHMRIWYFNYTVQMIQTFVTVLVLTVIVICYNNHGGIRTSNKNTTEC